MATQVVLTNTLADGGTDMTNTHIRFIIKASVLTDVVGVKIRVQFESNSGGTTTLDLAYIGKRDGATFNMVGGNKVQLKESGGAPITVPTGSTQWTDWADYDYTGEDDLLISVDVGTAYQNTYKGGETDKFWSSTNGAAADAAPGGGTQQIYHHWIKQIEIELVPSNVKKLAGVTLANVKKVESVLKADIKVVAGVSNQ